MASDYFTGYWLTGVLLILALILVQVISSVLNGLIASAA